MADETAVPIDATEQSTDPHELSDVISVAPSEGGLDQSQ